jgi:pimeloyl-ACP methyl ester carboxylesterase
MFLELAKSTVLDTPNGKIEYASVGDGPAVFISHGTLGGFDQGLAIAKLFEGYPYQFIAVSRAGYLRSDVSTGETPVEQADTYTNLLDKLGISQTVILGTSGGAPAAIQFALHHPNRCAGLILVSAISQAPPPLPPGMDKIVENAKITMQLDFIWWAMYKWALKTSLKMNGVEPYLIERATRNPGKMEILRGIFRPTVTSSLRINGVINDGEFIQKLKQYPVEMISVPTLIVHSKSDAMVPIEQARWAEKRIPDAKILEFDNGGHVCFVIHKEQFISEVQNFLNCAFDS